MWAGLPVDWSTGHRLLILQSTPSVVSSVAIDDFIVLARLWHTQPVTMTWHRSEVTNKDERLLLFFTAAHKGNHTIVRVVTVDPGEPFWITVQSAERWFLLVEEV